MNFPIKPKYANPVDTSRILGAVFNQASDNDPTTITLKLNNYFELPFDASYTQAQYDSCQIDFCTFANPATLTATNYDEYPSVTSKSKLTSEYDHSITM